MDINKIIGIINEARYDDKITADEALDVVQAIWLSPHLGYTISDKQQATIDEVLSMPEHSFSSGLKRETYQERAIRLQNEGVDIIIHG